VTSDGAAGAPRRCLTDQSPINAISRPAEAAAAVSTMATASVRKCGPWRRQLERAGGGDARSCTRCAVGSKPGGRAMGCTSVVARPPTIQEGRRVNHLSDLTGADSVPPLVGRGEANREIGPIRLWTGGPGTGEGARRLRALADRRDVSRSTAVRRGGCRMREGRRGVPGRGRVRSTAPATLPPLEARTARRRRA
jgi:hypothetical protein